MNADAMSGDLRRDLASVPVSVLCEYLGERLGQNTGKREFRILLKDGAYQGGRVVVPLGDLRK